MVQGKFLTYAIKDGRLVNVKSVENGLDCGCICPNCKSFLVAKNNLNNIKEAHFAHYNTEECEGAYESALHLLAKEIFRRERRLMLPDFHYDYDLQNKASLFWKHRVVQRDYYVELEKRIKIENELLVIDAVGVLEGRKIYVEFANTHFVEERKIHLLKQTNVPAIEIDISNQ